MNNIKTFQLVTGEIIVGVIAAENKNYINVQDPCIIGPSETQGGSSVLMPYLRVFPSYDETKVVPFNMGAVKILPVTPNKITLDAYNDAQSNIITPASAILTG